MNVSEYANRMRARETEKRLYQREFKHACFVGGNSLVMKRNQMTVDEDGTMYHYCHCCKKLFYATPTKQRELVHV